MDTSNSGATLGQKIKRSLLKWGVLGAVAAGLGFALWSWSSLHFVYSSGERAGYVQKFSKRGWLFKTWEGELAMVNLPGAMPEIFCFTVRDGTVVPAIETSMGHRVVLSYNQHRGVPPRIFGDTSYFIYKARPVNDAEASSPSIDPKTP